MSFVSLHPTFIEAFYNKNHSKSDGKFTSGAPRAVKAGPGMGVASWKMSPAQIARHKAANEPAQVTQGRAGSTPEQYKANQALLIKTRAKVRKRLAVKHAHDAKERSVKDEMYPDQKHLYDDEYTSERVLEFYNHVHDSHGRFATGGRASAGRAGFREGSPGAGKQKASTVHKTFKQLGSSISRFDKASMSDLAKHLSGESRTGKPARYTSVGPAARRGFNKIIAARRAGKSSATHVKQLVPQGEIYTQIKGAHTIRKTKNGFVLRSKLGQSREAFRGQTERPEKVSKRAAEQMKRLDDGTPERVKKSIAKVR